MSVNSPSPRAAADVRDGLGHTPVQQPGRLARGRVAAIRMELRRQVSGPILSPNRRVLGEHVD